MVYHRQIEGSSFVDTRGILNFFNSFNMTEVIRVYEISPANTNDIRGWQAHKNEKKWFYCNAGAIIVNLIEIDDFKTPSKTIAAKQFKLEATKPSILEITGGYATAFKAQEENSKLLVFSNFSLEESKNDDFRYALDQWSAMW